MNLPYGYTNKTHCEDGVVIKTYMGANARERYATELEIYQLLQGMTFMPDLIKYDETRLNILTKYIKNRHAQDLLDENGSDVMCAIGKLLRDLQEIQIESIDGTIRRGSEVLVHGDFGPQNVLLARDSFEIVGLVDWEWAHFGDKFEDIAWAEWLIRMHYEAKRPMIDALYDGFREMPVWETRHTFMIKKCEAILDFAKRDRNEQSITMWSKRIHRVRTFTE